MRLHSFLIALLLLNLSSAISSQPSDKESLAMEIDQRATEYGDLSMKIWGHAELGYLEFESSKLLQEKLISEGFEVKAGVAGMPTAFMASFGTGKPVIGILAEFDALPGVSQDAVPFRKEIEGKTAGHACGHHLFGTGGVAAAIAVKNWLTTSGTNGTIRVYGTPAEEGGSGKVYRVKAGLFDDVDATMYWHAGDQNAVRGTSNLAIVSAKFRFHGIASHAAGAPYRGRSALDGVEAMNYMVNLMREHVTPETRIHYVITRGGEAPNVVPAFAEVYYYVRHPMMIQVKEVLDWIITAADGAAKGTQTSMEYEILGGSFNVLPNDVLARTMHKNLEMVGGVPYDDQELAFARELMTTFKSAGLEPSDAEHVQELQLGGPARNSSTDSGDVSWAVPLVSMRAATWPPGTPGHSWQAVAAGATSMSRKGMIVAAKTLAMTAIDMFKDPEICQRAKAEFDERRGPGFVYKAVIGDREPALDYRKN